jgi:hypothetical protein
MGTTSSREDAAPCDKCSTEEIAPPATPIARTGCERCAAAALSDSTSERLDVAADNQAGAVDLFHQTDAATAAMILETQRMQPGTRGLAGGAIYFAATERLTMERAARLGVVLKARVRLGRILPLGHLGDATMSLGKLRAMGFDSVSIPRWDSTTWASRASMGHHEYAIYDPSQVIKIERA